MDIGLCVVWLGLWVSVVGPWAGGVASAAGETAAADQQATDKATSMADVVHTLDSVAAKVKGDLASELSESKDNTEELAMDGSSPL